MNGGESSMNDKTERAITQAAIKAARKIPLVLPISEADAALVVRRLADESLSRPLGETVRDRRVQVTRSVVNNTVEFLVAVDVAAVGHELS